MAKRRDVALGPIPSDSTSKLLANTLHEFEEDLIALRRLWSATAEKEKNRLIAGCTRVQALETHVRQMEQQYQLYISYQQAVEELTAQIEQSKQCQLDLLANTRESRRLAHQIETDSLQDKVKAQQLRVELNKKAEWLRQVVSLLQSTCLVDWTPLLSGGKKSCVLIDPTSKKSAVVALPDEDASGAEKVAAANDLWAKFEEMSMDE